MNEKERKRCLGRMIFRWIIKVPVEKNYNYIVFSMRARVVLYKREVYKTHKPTGKKKPRSLSLYF